MKAVTIFLSPVLGIGAHGLRSLAVLSGCRYFSINSSVTPLSAPDRTRKSFARAQAALSRSCWITSSYPLAD
jgi:hypothetical protein